MIEMDTKDTVYLLFWSLVASLVLFLMGFGKTALLMFPLSLVGVVFLERMEKAHYAIGAVILALAFSLYFAKSITLLSPLYMAAIMFLALPFALIEVRKRIRKN